jgi:maltose/moltooligosaccharide transporter
MTPDQHEAMPDDAHAARTYRCGSLVYTRKTLVALFGWLLWGDFCFSMMEVVLPNILPLKLKDLGVSNTLMSAVMTMIPGVFDITVGTVVSYKSDRYRGPRGRRIPFIWYTLPFQAVSLACIGWSEQIGTWLQHVMPFAHTFTPTTLTIGLIVVFMVSFNFFDQFVNSVYWYLFNDVVPPQLLGRFNGYFRIVGSIAGGIYNWFLFQHSVPYFREILSGVAILYFVGMGVMCLKVKEGSYPPPPEEEKYEGFFGKLKSVGKESFSNRFYWYFYLMSGVGALAGGVGMFTVFTNQQLNLTLQQQGILRTVGAFGGLIATYYASVFVDRWHPLRISTYNAIGGAFGAFGSWIWLFITLPSAVVFWPALIGSITGQFAAAMGALCGIATFMRLMPRSLYGQFSAANSVIRAIGRIAAGVLAGLFLDFLRWWLQDSTFAAKFGPDFVYRFGFLWSGTFSVLGAIVTCLAYREWLKLGGDEHYQAPAPWLPEGREPPAGVFKSVKSIPRWLRTAQNVGLVALAMNLGLNAFFTFEMYHSETLGEIGRWYAHVWWPLKLWLTAAGLVQYWQIMKDIRARERGEKTFFGLPHHGIWMVGVVTGLASFPTFWIQTQWIINLHLSYELYILGIANLVGLILGTLNTQVIRWVERDLTPEEDARLRKLIAASPPAVPQTVEN